MLWAQRKDFVLLKIDVPDVKGEKIEVDGSKVHFQGESQSRAYAVDLELHADVVKEVAVTGFFFLSTRCCSLPFLKTGEQVDR